METRERAGQKLALRKIELDYSSAGVTTKPVCAFVLADGKLDGRDELLRATEHAANRVQYRAAAAATGGALGDKLAAIDRRTWGKPPSFDCCAP